jgi:NAD(P)-dependent dehydrogenase (short-subunit alcohol dehydrogenase family)
MSSPRIISYLEVNPIFLLDIQETHKYEPITKMLDLLKKPTTRKLCNYLKHNPYSDTFYLILRMMPYPVIIAWYCEVNVLQYYWTSEMINLIIKTNLIQGQVYYYNKEYELGIQNLIQLNNHFDVEYNYTPNILRLRHEKNCVRLFKLLDDNLSTYNKELYFGSDYVKALGLNKKPQQITLFMKDKIIFKTKNKLKYCYPYYLLTLDDLTIKFYQFEQDFYKIILLGITDCVMTPENNIYCNARFYQNLSDHTINLTNSDKYSDVEIRTLYFTSTEKILNCLPSCYICKKYYNPSVWIDVYDNLCLQCAKENYINKNLSTNLTDMTFFVSGGRVKLGFGTCLKLLRCGAKVITSTRYPHFAMKNYQSESDYDSWKDNLTIIKCDFTKLQEIYSMIKLLEKYNLNGIINNACQTIKASDYYYSTVKEIESEIKDTVITDVDTHTHIVRYDDNLTVLTNIKYSNQLVKYTRDKQTNNFADIQDKPHDNSWDKSINEISPEEIVECTMINQIVPTILINSLKSRLSAPKFIINVTSFEGSFSYNAKNDKHPHTNMCKSAMNMLIRTLSEDLDKDLQVYAINPGYVSGICPQKSKYAISMDDGVSRITYPIIRHKLGHPLTKDYVLMHNYKPAPW